VSDLLVAEDELETGSVDRQRWLNVVVKPFPVLLSAPTLTCVLPDPFVMGPLSLVSARSASRFFLSAINRMPIASPFPARVNGKLRTEREASRLGVSGRLWNRQDRAMERPRCDPLGEDARLRPRGPGRRRMSGSKTRHHSVKFRVGSLSQKFWLFHHLRAGALRSTSH
jgi:hypothetical protein